jgi:DTW domain-containing protein YfiP
VVTCYCAHLTRLETRTRVLILQHPRERHVPIGTARLAHLCLPASQLRIGVELDDDPGVKAALGDATAPPYLLYPGPDAIDLASVSLPGPITLVVIDGTWWQAGKLLKRNPALARLPQLRFTPPAPSNYRIRREPAAHCVATVEALAHVLGALERDPARFATLLRPFEAMVETQLTFARTVHGARTRHASNRARHPRKPPVPALLRERARDVVCVHGEANAWPARRPGGHPAEIVHWLAQRPSTGETFEAVIAPRRPLAPSTPRHIGLAKEVLEAGEGWGDFRERWLAFARGADLLCAWGRYPLDVLEREGIALSPARLDVRGAAGAYLNARTGTVDECVARMGVERPAPSSPGRGGQRMAGLCAVVDRLLTAEPAMSS